MLNIFPGGAKKRARHPPGHAQGVLYSNPSPKASLGAEKSAPSGDTGLWAGISWRMGIAKRRRI